MKFEQYKELRNELENATQELIDAGKIEDSQAKMAEIKELDNKFEEVKLANANLNALKEQPQEVINLENKSFENKGELKTMTKFENVEINNQENLYANAFAKTLMQQELTTQENSVFMEMNNNQNTSNTGVVIPNTTLNEIISEIEAQAPFFADAKGYEYSGVMTIPKHKAIVSGDAKAYLESEETEKEINAFVDIQLGAKEVAKYIEVTFKLEAMSIPAFLQYIKSEIVERVGAELGRQAILGDGVKEMTGVLTALKDVDSQHSQYLAGGVSYENLTGAVSKIGAKHIAGTAIYASNFTVWNQLANVLDGNGRPLFVSDVMAGGVGRVLGFPVKVDSAIPDGTIIIGNAKGYAVNTTKPISVESERNLKARTTGFSAYTVVDGNVTHEKAFAILTQVV